MNSWLRMHSQSRIQNEFLAANAFEVKNPNSFWILDFEGSRSHEFICDSDGGAYETEARMHSDFEGIRSHEFILDS